MRASARLLFPAVLAAAAACGGEANAPDAWPTRAQLTGVYEIGRAHV